MIKDIIEALSDKRQAADIQPAVYYVDYDSFRNLGFSEEQIESIKADGERLSYMTSLIHSPSAHAVSAPRDIKPAESLITCDVHIDMTEFDKSFNELLNKGLICEDHNQLAYQPNTIYIPEQTICFNSTKSDEPILELKPNGDIFVKGRLVENDREVVSALREFLGMSCNFVDKGDY